MLWWDTNWQRRISINITDPQPGLRVRVLLSQVLRPGFLYSDCKSAGEDIRIISADGVTALDFEIENWNASGESNIWVRLPDTSPPSSFDMYYKYSAATTESDPEATFPKTAFGGVWHLSQDPAGVDPALKDATDNNFDLTVLNPANCSSVDFMVGKGVKFHTVANAKGSAWYPLQQDEMAPFPGTISAVLSFHDDSIAEWKYIIHKSGASAPFYSVYLDAARILKVSLSQGYGGNSITLTGPTIASDTRYLIHFTRENNPAKTIGTGKLYVNGVLVDTVNAAWAFDETSHGQYFLLAQDNAGQVSKKFNGTLDEVRIIIGAKSATFISADYKSHVDTLCVWGEVKSAPAHSITLTLAGTKRTAYLVLGSINISDTYNNRRTARFRLVDEVNWKRDGADPYRPVRGNSVKLEYDTTTIFAGTIDRVVTTIPQARAPSYHDIECVDYTQLCDKRLVARIYENMLAGDIVKDIILKDLSSEGISNTYVGAGLDIIKIVFPYCTVTEAIADLARMSAYNWRVDYQKNLRFYDPATNAAPFDLADDSGNYRDFKYTGHRELYRNRQWLRAGMDTTETQQEKFLGTGIYPYTDPDTGEIVPDPNAARSWQLQFAVAEEPIIEINGVQVPVGIRGQNDGEATMYFVKGEKEITYDAELDPLLTTDDIEVTYKGLYPIFEFKQSSTEIAARVVAEGGSGYYEDIIEDQSIESADYAGDYLTMMLRKNGVFADLTYFDYQTDTAGLESGMSQSIILPEFGISDTVMIQSVRTHDVMTTAGPILRHDIRAIGGEDIGGWAEFWKQMASYEKKQLREGESLSLLLGFDEEIVISETFSTVTALDDADDDHFSVAKVGYWKVGYTFSGKDSLKVSHTEAVGNGKMRPPE